MDLIKAVARHTSIPIVQVEAAVKLLDSDNTIPFIARYRKEITGSLDEEQLRLIEAALEKLRNLYERRSQILKSIQEQGKLTSELATRIEAAQSRTELEDLYLPFRPKRKTRASVARELGLQPLADLLLEQPGSVAVVENVIEKLLGDAVPDRESALAGARDIIAEMISDNAGVRSVLRDTVWKHGVLNSQAIETSLDASRTYELYYEFSSRLDKLQAYQVLAINRGENEKVLRVQVIIAEKDWQQAIFLYYPVDQKSPAASQISLAAEDSAKRLLVPAIDRDIRRMLTERAEVHAIKVFADNLRSLLSQPPISDRVILGIDPGYRTGCKAAVIDPTGKVLVTRTIYPHQPQNEWEQAKAAITNLISKFDVSLIVIGNGTASRETEQLAAEIIREKSEVYYLIVNEAGASVYSASPLARKELPDLDVSMRGAVSIARRAQDPLAELVKISPRSIGVGMYQHDVDQQALTQALEVVVESVVNRVGVNANTASAALLGYVSGIGPRLAEKIVEYRDSHGPFASRKNLLEVSGLGPKAYEQAAGFLRILAGIQPLDETAIHPESYPKTEMLLQRAGVSLQSPIANWQQPLRAYLQKIPEDRLANELEIGLPTLRDIIEQIQRPRRDPRDDLPAPLLRSDILKIEDLHPGLILAGTVRNVVDFGVFIDVGVKQDGLLHRSQIPAGFKYSVGEIHLVKILSVDVDRNRISLAPADG